MYKRLYTISMLVLWLAVVVLCFAILAKPDAAFAARLDIVGDSFGISLLQDGPLFHMEDFAPGDSGNASVTVKNIGDFPFFFTIDSKKDSGDELLFKNLMITIKNNDGTLSYYSGPLSELEKVDLGSILQGGEKQLNLSIYFPVELGNEFQGKTLSMAFVFTADMEDRSIQVINEAVPFAPVTTPAPGPTTVPGRIDVPNERIPQTGETSPEIFYIVGLLLAVLCLKTVHTLNRHRHPDD